MDAPSNKVVAATMAGTVASALCTIGLWLLHQYGGVEAPEPVQAAVLVLVTALCTGVGAFLAGYFRPEHRPSRSAVATVHRERLR